MKRVLTCALALLMLLSLTVPAFADIIWEPSDNAFYDDHRDACVYKGQCYYANGKNGFVTLVNAPGASFALEQVENGKVLWVGYTYNDKWALVSLRALASGWVPLSDLTLIYDYLCFAEEYGDKITDYNGEFADYNGDIETVNFYAYPGAAEIEKSFEFPCDRLTGMDVQGNLIGTGEYPSCIKKIFVDEDGRTWGFIGHMRDHRYGNAWFCLDEPDGENFPIREVSVEKLASARKPVPSIADYLPYILVAAVVGATAVILVYFYGKRKKSTV